MRKARPRSYKRKSKMTYRQQLKTEEWKAKRLEILERDGHKCTECGSTESLQVHHLYYRKTKLAWEYPNKALATLCKDCHEDEHIDKFDGHIVIAMTYKFKGDEFRFLWYLSSLRKKQKSNTIKFKLSDAANAIKVTENRIASMIMELNNMRMIYGAGKGQYKLMYRDVSNEVQEIEQPQLIPLPL